MPDDRDPNEGFVRSRLRAYLDSSVAEAPLDHLGIARRARARSGSSGRIGALVLALGAIVAVVVIGRALPMTSGTSSVRPPASTCGSGSWPTTAITCEAAFRIGDQAGAQVDRARIWLTTLSAVKAAMDPRQQVVEPSGTATVWVIVYDGSWVCCPLAFDEDGKPIPETEVTRWLVVAEATREGTGFIYLQDWSDRAVPDQLPLP